MIRDIQKHAQALHDLVDTVLELSRLDNKRISTQRQALNMTELMVETVEEQLFLAQKRVRYCNQPVWNS